MQRLCICACTFTYECTSLCECMTGFFLGMCLNPAHKVASALNPISELAHLSVSVELCDFESSGLPVLSTGDSVVA